VQEAAPQLHTIGATMIVRRIAPALVPLLLGCQALDAAEPSRPLGPRIGSVVKAKLPASPSAPKLLDFVAEPYRDAVAAVLKSPTLTAKASEAEYDVYPAVYDWLLEHPDRTSLAWQRLEIPCVDITDLGKGQFYWTDEFASELSWQTVGTFENGRIWFATGKVKAGGLIPTIPVKAVVILQSPRTAPDATGMSRIKPQVNIVIQSDSAIATALLKLAGSQVPKVAEDGAEQLLLYFSGIARTIHKNPDRLAELLGPRATKKPGR